MKIVNFIKTMLIGIFATIALLPIAIGFLFLLGTLGEYVRYNYGMDGSLTLIQLLISVVVLPFMYYIGKSVIEDLK